MKEWLRVVDAASNLAHLAGRFRRPDQAQDPAVPPIGGPLERLETRLAGVVVAALKEAFDRDRARMDLEREHLEAERRRAEEALRAELRRQAAERVLGQLRMVAVMAIAAWMLSAVLAVWLPGMRAGAARAVLGAGWAGAIAALGCAFAGWQRISHAAGGDDGVVVAGAAAGVAPWLLIAAIALGGLSLLIAL